MAVKYLQERWISLNSAKVNIIKHQRWQLPRTGVVHITTHCNQVFPKLLEVAGESSKDPQTVMLGHISSQRNEPAMAVAETVALFEEAGKKLEFELLAAPLRECSGVIEVG